MMQSCCHRSRGFWPGAPSACRCSGLSSEDSEPLSDSEPEPAAASGLLTGPEATLPEPFARGGGSNMRPLSLPSRGPRPRGPPTPCLKTPPSLFAASSSCARFTARLLVWNFSLWMSGLFCWTVSAYCGIGDRTYSSRSSSLVRNTNSQARCWISTSWLSRSSSRKGTTSDLTASGLAFNSFTAESMMMDFVCGDAPWKCL
mmetsp:Transcript_73252/g.218578  ORF Transcript_73252/g.218578 Transcript_73252/m.218578 type:complete len:201 (+) Transcript_73252:801-1403(+)